jgi:hypothetical protein
MTFLADGSERLRIGFADFDEPTFRLVSLTKLHCRFAGLAAGVEGPSLYSGGKR